MTRYDPVRDPRAETTCATTPFDGTGWSPRTAETAQRLSRPAGNPASDKQRGYLRSLESERQLPDGYTPKADDAALTSPAASSAIDALLALPRKPRAAALPL